MLSLILSLKLLTVQERTDWSAIYSSASPSVVTVRAGKSVGSGFFVKDGSHVATCYHVVAGESEIEVVTDKGSRIKVVKIAFDRPHDVAILELSEATLRTPLALGGESPVKPGVPVAAIGSPLGLLDRSLSAGVVSAVREIDGTDVLQITAEISPGSSGSPVFDSAGKVIGMASATFEGLGHAQGLNIAVVARYVSGCVERPFVETGAFALTIPGTVSASVRGPETREAVTRTWAYCVSQWQRAWDSLMIANSANAPPQAGSTTLRMFDRLADVFHDYIGGAPDDLVANGMAGWAPEELNALREAVRVFRSTAIDWINAEVAWKEVIRGVPSARAKEEATRLTELLGQESTRCLNAYSELTGFYFGPSHQSFKGWFDPTTYDNALPPYAYSSALPVATADPEFPNVCAIGLEQAGSTLKRGDVIVAVRVPGEVSWTPVENWKDFSKWLEGHPGPTEVKLKYGKTAVLSKTQATSYPISASLPTVAPPGRHASYLASLTSTT